MHIQHWYNSVCCWLELPESNQEVKAVIITGIRFGWGICGLSGFSISVAPRAETTLFQSLLSAHGILGLGGKGPGAGGTVSRLPYFGHNPHPTQPLGLCVGVYKGSCDNCILARKLSGRRSVLQNVCGNCQCAVMHNLSRSGTDLRSLMSQLSP